MNILNFFIIFIEFLSIIIDDCQGQYYPNIIKHNPLTNYFFYKNIKKCTGPFCPTQMMNIPTRIYFVTQIPYWQPTFQPFTFMPIQYVTTAKPTATTTTTITTTTEKPTTTTPTTTTTTANPTTTTTTTTAKPTTTTTMKTTTTTAKSTITTTAKPTTTTTTAKSTTMAGLKTEQQKPIIINIYNIIKYDDYLKTLNDKNVSHKPNNNNNDNNNHNWVGNHNSKIFDCIEKQKFMVNNMTEQHLNNENMQYFESRTFQI